MRFSFLSSLVFLGQYLSSSASFLAGGTLLWRCLQGSAKAVPLWRCLQGSAKAVPLCDFYDYIIHFIDLQYLFCYFTYINLF